MLIFQQPVISRCALSVEPSVVSPKQLAYIVGRQSFGDTLSGRDSRPTIFTRKLRDTILVSRHLLAYIVGRQSFGDAMSGRDSRPTIFTSIATPSFCNILTDGSNVSKLMIRGTRKAVNRRWTPIYADSTRRYRSGNIHPPGASALGRNPINLFWILAFIGVYLRFQG